MILFLIDCVQARLKFSRLYTDGNDQLSGIHAGQTYKTVHGQYEIIDVMLYTFDCRHSNSSQRAFQRGIGTMAGTGLWDDIIFNKRRYM